MCQPAQSQDAPNPKDVSVLQQSVKQKSVVQPLPLLAILPLLPLLPTSSYLNRGYTVWFHLCSLAYIPTRSAFLRKFLILQGFAICTGWYAAIINEYVSDGNFCHALYRNMPERIVNGIVHEHDDGYDMLHTYMAWGYKFLSHVLDILGHPTIVYIFWRVHKSYGETWRDVLSWPVIIAAWHMSRLWSVVHSYYNNGTFDCWYFGYDVYVLNNTSVYLTAYISEGLCFGIAVIWKLWFEKKSPLRDDSILLLDLVSVAGKKEKEERTPMLVHSESTFSTSSMIR